MTLRPGRRLEYWGRDNVVVGVVADVRDEEVQSGTTYAFYASRHGAGWTSGTFVLRSTVDPLSLVAPLRQRVQSVHADAAITSAEPLDHLVADQIAGERYRTRLVLVFAGLASLFSLMGIYGVTARKVAARTREVGIRLALGARRDGILGMVVGSAVRLSVLGAAIGILVSFATTRGIEACLWGVERTDTLTLITTALGLAIASTAAALAPAMRAARINPVEALRQE